MERYCKFTSITFHKGLVESEAWRGLTKSQIDVFIYIWSCLKWAKEKKKWGAANNGDIEISTIKMRTKLGLCKGTCTTAIHKLIEVGFIKITYRGGMGCGDMNKYKLLWVDDVRHDKMRWKRYPNENWEHEIPKVKDYIVGKETRFKKKNNTLQKHTLNGANPPTKVDPINANPPTKVGSN